MATWACSQPDRIQLVLLTSCLLSAFVQRFCPTTQNAIAQLSAIRVHEDRLLADLRDDPPAHEYGQSCLTLWLLFLVDPPGGTRGRCTSAKYPMLVEATAVSPYIHVQPELNKEYGIGVFHDKPGPPFGRLLLW